jgi:hypothetical protein
MEVIPLRADCAIAIWRNHLRHIRESSLIAGHDDSSLPPWPQVVSRWVEWLAIASLVRWPAVSRTYRGASGPIPKSISAKNSTHLDR